MDKSKGRNSVVILPATADNPLERAVRGGQLTRRRRAPSAVAWPALAVGAFALGAFAMGALAIGFIAINRLAINKARIRRLEIDELIVRRRQV